MDNYLDQLNEAQRAAVEYLGGPELVIAGAGSGKTRVLTYKIMHLIRNGIHPARIMALTFTNKAAAEMRERIGRIVGEETASKLWMGTFHSIFSRMLRRNAELIGFKSNFTIYDTSDSKSLIKTIIRELQLSDDYKPGTVLGEISNAKNNLYLPADYARDKDIARANAACKRPRMDEIYTIYCERCRKSCAMDFDDLLVYTNILLRDHPEVLAGYRDFFQYVLVDEYQDTNFAQHMIVRQLTDGKGNLCVVGDDAQSIYSFRGANIRNILDMKKNIPDLRTFKLEANYRSTGMIVDAANSLIACNKEQIRKDVYSTHGRGERIEVVKAFNEYEEGNMVANRISQIRMRNGDNYSDIAILYRTNAQSRVLEESLRNRNIPYRIYGGVAFYQRKEIKDVISYFRLAVNPTDDEALRRVINTPKRGIGDTTVDKLTAAAFAGGASIYEVIDDPERYFLNVNRGTLAKLRGFAALIGGFIADNNSGVPAPELARTIIEKTGILAEYVNAGNAPENVSKRDNILELINAVDSNAETFREQNADREYMLGDFLAEVALLTDMDTQEAGDDCVTMMTIHAAKGLEFESVFIVGVEEELLPNGMCLHGPNAAQELEEERRLMYVALTRAKRFCMISFASRRTVNGMTNNVFPSRFIKEIDPSYLRMMTGTQLDPDLGFGARRQRPERPSVFDAARKGTSPSAPRQIFVEPKFTRPASPAPAAAPVPADCTVHCAAELQEGARISHPRFGTGTIEAVDTSGPDSRIVVAFEDGNNRTLLLKFAKFKLL